MHPAFFDDTQTFILCLIQLPFSGPFAPLAPLWPQRYGVKLSEKMAGGHVAKVLIFPAGGRAHALENSLRGPKLLSRGQSKKTRFGSEASVKKLFYFFLMNGQKITISSIRLDSVLALNCRLKLFLTR